MPVNSTATVTARDRLVIAFDDRELLERMEFLRRRENSDATVRDRFFDRARSTKYPPGDTRGWRLTEARERLQNDGDWNHRIRRCLYRPFDWRSIYWTPGMIDWPRENVMNHMLACRNVALIARRQTPPALPATYFWVTDTIAVDGVVRSDNRGSESVFPLFLCRASAENRTALLAGEDMAAMLATPRPNFTDSFVRDCEERLGLRWDWPSTEESDNTFGPLELLAFAYALFHAPSYRNRFASSLRIEFPRLFIPRNKQLFHTLSACGAGLFDVHLMRKWHNEGTCHPGQTPQVIESGYPRYRTDQVQLNRHAALGPVARDVWEFRVGTYQVCKKWLKDRVGQQLDPLQQQQYCHIVTAIDRTLQLMHEIDRAIEEGGGWDASF